MGIKINDNGESVTCRVCGEQCKRIYGKHLKYKHNGMTTKEYKEMFPGAPIMALSDRKNTTKNSGKHMKQEKYRKMFSEKILGVKNPNHSSKITKEQRRSRSPFSKDFIKYEGIENLEEHISNFVKDAIKDRVHPTTLQYYINRGYSEEDAKLELKKRQTTFSKEICVEKYGEERGMEVWLERQYKWQESLLSNGNIKCGYSKVSQELFYLLMSKYEIEYLPKIYFATKNKEYFISKKGDGFYAYDFADLNSKKIIEYNGDVYHGNPVIYDGDDYPHPYYRENGPTAREMWERDEHKLNIAKEYGFETLTIWGSEYRNDKEKTIKKCLDFLEIN